MRNKAAASTVPLPGGFLRQTMEIVGGPGRPLLGSDCGAEVWRASALARVEDSLSTVPFPAWQSVEPRVRRDHRICEGRMSARNPNLTARGFLGWNQICGKAVKLVHTELNI